TGCRGHPHACPVSTYKYRFFTDDRLQMAHYTACMQIVGTHAQFSPILMTGCRWLALINTDFSPMTGCRWAIIRPACRLRALMPSFHQF
ncbi:MAG: hypothetical protein Q8O46_05270, partial [bacterium]|nr:hypothetical protein [bacterium]